MARTALVWAAAVIGLVSATGTTRVKPGQSIQAAINAAKPGDRILVEAGTYSEYLTISKNGINLVGQKGAILTAPSPAGETSPKGCADIAGNGTFAGICIIGTNVQFMPFITEHRKVKSVGTYVEGVRVEGLEVRGFNGLNIAVVGAKDAEVRDNTVSDGAMYGILTVGSHSSLITRNTVKSSSLLFIGICMDDQSDVSVTQNLISDYGIGLCVQTNGANVGYNKVTNCCFGAFVDPGVNGAQLMHNKFGPSNPLCNPYFGGAAAGITIGGAINTEVLRNDITGTTDGGNPNNTAAGILIYDDGTNIAKNNHVTFNDLSNNDQDLAIFSAGSNEVKHNKCSNPSDLCSNQ